MSGVTILGIDPGSQVVGFGIVHLSDDGVRHMGHGNVILNTKEDFAYRLLELGQAMQKLLQQFQPQALSVEQIFLGKNADSAFKLGHARGVILYEARVFGCRIHEYATRSVKKGITGRGGADKEEVRWLLQKLFRLGPITSLDASDALALACHHAYEYRRHCLLSRQQGLERV